MSENLWTFDKVEIGQEGRPVAVAVTDLGITEFRAVSRSHPAPGQHAMPTMVFAYAPLMRESIANENGFTALEQSATQRRQTPFTKCEVRWFAAVAAGDTITSRRHVLEKYERRGSNFVTFRVEATNQDGARTSEYDYTCVFDHTPSRKSAGAHRSDDREHKPLDSITIAHTQETMNTWDAFSLFGNRGLRSNIHTDEAFARKSIFGATVVSGPALMTHADQLLARAYASDDLSRLLLRAIVPVRPGDTVTFSRYENGVIEARNQDRRLACLAEFGIRSDGHDPSRN